jgi:hypothetical protein
MASPEAPENPSLTHIGKAGAESENFNPIVDQMSAADGLLPTPAGKPTIGVRSLSQLRVNESLDIRLKAATIPSIAFLAANAVVICGHSIPPRSETIGFPSLAQNRKSTDRGWP